MNDLWKFLISDSGRVSLTIAAMAISAVITVTIFRLNLRRKSLAYEFLSMTRVLTLREEVSGRVRILFDDQVVKDVGIVQIRIANRGTEPFESADFVRPIMFGVTKGAKIIDADITMKTPTSLDAALHKEENSVTLLPTLLNPKDSMTVKLLISNFDGKIEASARLKGANLEMVMNRWRAFGVLLPSICATIAVAALTWAFTPRHVAIWPLIALAILWSSLLGVVLKEQRVFDRARFPNDYL